jgi:voltage-gated potassium channel
MINPLDFFKKLISFIAAASLALASIGAALLLLTMALHFVEKSGVRFADTLYLSAITFLTVGYGDLSPATDMGRILSVLIGGLGIVFMGIIVGASIKALEAASKRRHANGTRRACQCDKGRSPGGGSGSAEGGA